jgi:hypothetical protein
MSPSADSVSPHGVVYIDSETERFAWLTATFGEQGAWSVASQMLRMDEHGRQLEVLEIELVSGERVGVSFGEAAADDSLAGENVDRTGDMEDLMQRAAAFAEANPPHHPGSLPRFPVPSPSYRDAIAIPMPVLAVDNGVRGLYAPPRQVAISRRDKTLVGVGEFPGFDPEHWPPPRLGDWPPSQLHGLPQIQLQAMIARFSACWSRVLDAWFDEVVTPTPVLVADIKEALHRRTFLDLMSFLPYYERLNPVFAKWLSDMVAGQPPAMSGR